MGIPSVSMILDDKTLIHPKFSKQLKPYIIEAIPDILIQPFAQVCRFETGSFKNNEFEIMIQTSEGLLFIRFSGLLNKRLTHLYFQRDEISEIVISGYTHLTQNGLSTGKLDKIKYDFVSKTNHVLEVYKPHVLDKKYIEIRSQELRILENDYKISRGMKLIAGELQFGFWRTTT